MVALKRQAWCWNRNSVARIYLLVNGITRLKLLLYESNLHYFFDYLILYILGSLACILLINLMLETEIGVAS